MPLHRRMVLGSVAGLGALAGASSAVALSEALPRKITPSPDPRREVFDFGWRFALGHASDPHKDFDFGLFQNTFSKQGAKVSPVTESTFDDSAWAAINLPHDWAVELPFTANPDFKITGKPEDWDTESDHGYKPIGRKYPQSSIGWYRKAFHLDPTAKAKRISLEFDGVFRNATVIFNGYIVKSHDGGYTPFRVDVTDFVNTDDSPNIVVVRVDASLGEGWFYEGAGLYRHVWLTITDPLHIPQYGVWVKPRTDGKVDVTVSVRNDSDTRRRAHIGLKIMNSAKAETGTGHVEDDTALTEIGSWESIDVNRTITVPAPRLWSLEDPHLYGLEVTLSEATGAIIDQMTTRFGFRDIRFDAEKGVFLNGKSIKLKGTCNHQDHAGVGAAIPDALTRWRLQQLKAMGCNAYRTAHNPPAPEMLDACDELGILVIDETRLMSASEDGLAQLETLVRRDRNHPSVILWSIGNEEPQQGSARGLKIARTMKRVVNRLDPTRLITAAMDQKFGDGITPALDVVGFNYRDTLIDDFHKAHPEIPIIGTETASTVATRGEYRRDNQKHLVPAYDTDAPWWATTAEGWWPHFNEKPYIGGGFIWTGFDYRGEPTPFNVWPSISSQFGVFDTCGFPKDAYYYYRAWWRAEPLLHLFPHWTWAGRDGQPISVWAYSNCDEVELFVNGKSVGRKMMAKDRHVAWEVPYAPGRIEAYGYKNGQVILKDSRQTAGPAARIILTTDRKSLNADRVDIAVIKAEVVDAKGILVPHADALLQFDVTGPARIIGVGNGNPNSHEPDKASQRRAFNGLACAIVQSNALAGEVRLTARADGLATGQVNLKLI